MPSATPLDICGRRRSPATLPDFREGRPPRNKGLRYPADPPTVEEIIAVMRAAGDDADAVRLRGLIVVLWRAGLRISEALALTESDLDPSRGAILVRHGKGGKRREVGMDRWGWQQLDPWLQVRAALPVGGAVLRAARPDPGSTVGTRRRSLSATCRRRQGRGASPVRAASAAARARGRDVARRSAAAGHPTPTRPTCRSRDHLRLPPRNRQHRDHPRRPRTAGSDDPGDKRTEDLSLTHPYRRVVSGTTHRLCRSPQRHLVAEGEQTNRPSSPRLSSAVSPFGSSGPRTCRV